MNGAFRQPDSQRNVQDDSRRNPLRNLPPHSPAPLRPDPISCPWYGKPSDPGCRGRKGDDRAGLPERARSRIPSLHPPPPRLSQDIDNVAMTNLVGKGDIEVLRPDARRRVSAPRGSARRRGQLRDAAAARRVCVSAAAKDSRLSPQTLPAQDCAQGEGYPGPAAAAAPFSAARRRGRRSGQPPEGGGGGRERECAAEVKHAPSVSVAQIKHASSISVAIPTRRRYPFGGAPK